LRTTSLQHPARISRLKLLLALSRTPHGLLDLATPVLGAVLWLDGFPPAEIMAMGLITAFSGYTAVYAFNDVVDYRVDQEKLQISGISKSDGDLDGVFARHPLARHMLSYRQAVFWAGAWTLLALARSYWLNPVCAVIFLAASFLEFLYCRLLKVTYLRGVISGVVKNSGATAAVFAVDPAPDFSFLAVLFIWFFFWEIGGQNIPNDWSDLREDKSLRAKTIPVYFGPEKSTRLILISLMIAVVMSLLIVRVAPGRLGPVYLIGAFISGLYFLVLPAVRLLRNKDSRGSCNLFNRASYYPAAMLLVTVINWLFQINGR
jgi:4-hydroxybenzoate polyprenyltransferase